MFTTHLKNPPWVILIVCSGWLCWSTFFPEIKLRLNSKMSLNFQRLNLSVYLMVVCEATLYDAPTFVLHSVLGMRWSTVLSPNWGGELLLNGLTFVGRPAQISSSDWSKWMCVNLDSCPWASYLTAEFSVECRIGGEYGAYSLCSCCSSCFQVFPSCWALS